MTDLDKTDLLPCPFCGNTNVQMVTFKHEDGDVLHAVGCPKCECNGAPHIAVMDDPRPAAAAAWNQRTALLTAPPGYVLVPVEPTPLMIATFRADNEHGALSWMTHTTLRCADFRSRYAGMLAAAPEVK